MTNEAHSNLTAEQHAALSAHDRTVSLAAGAGCGKTFVLTERYLSYLDPRQLEPSAELSELVAITFTDAAAREMRDRIRRRCYQRLQSATDLSEQAAWTQLLATLDGARISTIHSFCTTLLRNHAAEATLDPQFEVLDAAAAELLRLRSLDDHLRQLLISADGRVIQLATRFGLRSLRDYAAELLGSNSAAVITEWHGKPAAELVRHWQSHYQTQYAPAAASTLLATEQVQRLRELCRTADVSTSKFQTRAGEILDLLDGLNSSDEPHVAVAQLRELARVQGVTTKKDWTSQADFEEFKNICKAVRDLTDKSILGVEFAEQPLHEAATYGLDLLQLVAEVNARYDREKLQRNALEFDDLLSRTHSLLTDSRFPHVRQNLARHTRLLMVDEFQDTDPLQVAIVKALRGDNWSEQGLFVVGDFKQSIYRFRGAEPRVSNELRATLPEESRLSLTTNFRSQPAILDFVNSLFFDAFPEGYEPLVSHRPQLSPTPAVEFLWSPPNDERNNQISMRRRGDTARARMQEARYIARRLAQLLDAGEPLVVENADNGEPTARPLQLGDIAILLRTLSDVALYEEALREYGLDYYLAGGHAFYAQQEIYDVLHLLRAIASPIDELSLAGVLRSPMFSLTDETLFWLVEHDGSLNGGLFAESLPEQLTVDERVKVVHASTTIGTLRQRKDQLLVAELLAEAIAATGYDATLLTEFLGERKLANIQKLIDQARTLDRTRPGDLNGFVTQLSEFVVRTPKEPLAATRGEGEVIRIMTIHYAKGLEFPLVVVPDLERQSNHMSHQPVFDDQLGPLVPAAEKQHNVGWDLYQFAEAEQEREERKRLLYVACTRAADYLLLSSSVANLEKPKSDWMKLLGEHFDLADGSCLTNLPEGYPQPEIRVTQAEPETTRKPAASTRGTDLQKMLVKTHQLVAASKGVVPADVKPIPVNTQARRFFSFSRLSGELILSRESPVASRETGTNTSSNARGLGSLVHAVLERIEFTQPTVDLASWCEYLAPQYVENGWRNAAADATGMLKRFFGSPRFAQLTAARTVHREVEFMLPWPIVEQSHGDQPLEGRTLHGYIDCLYQDAEGSWHLLDYKSNRVTADGLSKLADHYALQMYVYHLACKRALGVAPVETVLYFLRPGEEHAFTWNSAEATALINKTDRAIDSALSG